MISSRYGRITMILLFIALVPTVIHHYIGIVGKDDLTSQAINRTLAGLLALDTDRRDTWIKATFDSEDWIERRYKGQGDENVLLFAARSYNLKRLYHHPEIAILRGVDLEEQGVKHMPRLPHVPVHVMKHRANKGVAAYVLLYDGEFIENPIMQQIMTSIELLFSPRKAMTLFMVYDENAAHEGTVENSLALRVLAEAVQSFMTQKGRVL